MRFFSLENLSSLKVEDIDPRTAPQRPGFADKEEFRRWCEQPTTHHCFYSHVEGFSPSTRTGKDGEGENDNPPLLMHGWTADYDTDVNIIDAVAQVGRNSEENLSPIYASQTFSNGIRLTWEFEEPVYVDNADIALRFLEEVAKLVGAKRLLAGFDTASLKTTQYWEAGTNWTKIGSKAIKKHNLTAAFIRAANSVTVSTEYNIPLEAVEEEVMKRWPQRIKALKEGERLPLFWVEPFVERIGAIVGKYGMLCFSTRAGKSLVPWSEILGHEFAREYRDKRIGEAAENLYYDGRHYWRPTMDGGRWANYNKEDTIMYLKGMGISPRPPKNKYVSEAEEVLLMAQSVHKVTAAAPLIHDARRIVDIHGERYLNISHKPLMKPAESGDPKDFPWLDEFFKKIWSDPKTTQRDHYLAWLRHAYINCLDGRPAQGCAVFISGPKSSGKTFLNFHILGAIFGGCSNASEFLLGNTNFNKGDSEHYIWAIDDDKGSATWENKRAFSSNIKKYVANPTIRVEAKGRDSFEMPWAGRISVTCNLDKESRAVLPQTHGEILDKVCFFQWNCWKAPFLPNRKSEEAIRAELPFFLRWLVNWTPPAYVIDKDPRFGIVPFHHQSMLDDANENSGAMKLKEMLDEWQQNSPKMDHKVWLTPTGIKRTLSIEPAFREALSKELGRERLSQALQELGIQSRKRPNGSTEYLIYEPKV